MTKLNEKRDELAIELENSIYRMEPWQEPPGFDECFKQGFDAAIAEVMPMMREMAEKSRSLGHAVVMGQKEDIIFATKELSDVLNKYSELVGK